MEVVRTKKTTKKSHGRRLDYFCMVFLVCVLVAAGIFLIFYNPHHGTYRPPCGPGFPEFAVQLGEPVLGSDGSYTSRSRPELQGLKFPPGKFWSDKNGTVFGCICSMKSCIRKCCPYKEEINSTYACVPSSDNFSNLLLREVYKTLGIIESAGDLQRKSVGNDHFFFLSDRLSCPVQLMNKTQDTTQQTYLMEDGRLLTMNKESPYLQTSQFCLDKFEVDNKIHPIVCLSHAAEEPRDLSRIVEYMKTACMLVSIPFLLVTLLANLPEQKSPQANLTRKMLLSHVTSLTVAFTAHSATHFIVKITNANTILCTTMGFTMQYSFLACFFWLNIMCFDMWRGITSLKRVRNQPKKAIGRKFVRYSLYAWGLPFVMAALSAIMDLAPGVPDYFIKPGIGVITCWFKDHVSKLVYFYIPVGMLMSVNLVMFTFTACRLHNKQFDKQKKKGFSKQQTDGSDKQQTDDFTNAQRHCVEQKSLYLKIFIVMGVTWVMEVISFVIGGQQFYWILFDLFNTLQGPIMFMFAVDREKLKAMYAKFCPGRKRQYTLT